MSGKVERSLFLVLKPNLNLVLWSKPIIGPVSFIPLNPLPVTKKIPPSTAPPVRFKIR